MKLTLAITLFAPMLCAQAMADTGPTYSANLPTGAGDPDAITCFQPGTKVGWHLPQQPVCRTNATWARYRKSYMDKPDPAASPVYYNAAPQLSNH